MLLQNKKEKSKTKGHQGKGTDRRYKALTLNFNHFTSASEHEGVTAPQIILPNVSKYKRGQKLRKHY
jgi:hypothetical protein